MNNTPRSPTTLKRMISIYTKSVNAIVRFNRPELINEPTGLTMKELEERQRKKLNNLKKELKQNYNLTYNKYKLLN